MHNSSSTCDETFPSRFYGDVTALLVLFLAFIVFYFPVLFGDSTFFFRDATLNNYPVKYFLHQAYQAGYLPFWNPLIHNGYPFLAELHPGVFYPFNLIFFLPNFTTAFNLFFLAHYLFLAITVYALMRSWGLRPVSALCSGLTAMLGGYFLSLIYYNTPLQCASWLPSLFLFHDRYLKTGNSFFCLGTLIASTFLILGGSPESIVLTFLTLYTYSLFVVPGAKDISEYWRRTWVLGVIAILSLGLAAPQIFPTLELIGHSVRNKGLDYDHHTIFSLSFTSLRHLIFPENFQNLMRISSVTSMNYITSHYMGGLAILALCTGFLFLRKKEFSFWIAVLFFSLFFAFGKYNPVYEYFYQNFPLIKLFRFPSKFYYLTAFSLVFLVGFAVDTFFQRGQKGSFFIRPQFLLLAILFLGGLALSFLLNSDGDRIYFPILILLFGVLWGLFQSSKINLRLFQVSIVFILVIDLFVAHYSLMPMVDKKFYLDKPPIAQLIETDKEKYRLFSEKPRHWKISNGSFSEPSRLLDQYSKRERMTPNLGMIHGVQDFQGMVALELRYASVLGWVFEKSSHDKRLRILKRSNVKYWIDKYVHFDESQENPFVLKKSLNILEDALPRAFLVPNARVEQYPRSANLYFEESFDPELEVIVDQVINWENNRPLKEGRVEEIQYLPNQVRVKSWQDGDGFLVLLDSYFPGWSVEVDGKPQALLRGNHFFRAVQLGPGSHNLLFSYEAEGFKEGVFIFWGTLFVILGMIFGVSRAIYLKKV